ncbi:MAG TPA: class I SAM-dependent methyltransferase [Rhabdochlamydiaceae bacterium]|nr:class I SAM-dependent methyltransferase [Rhabdochlamydiaceae bacterium]
MLCFMSQFPIFNSYQDLSHSYWQKILKVGDWAIDATCGNGKDSLKLAQMVQGGGGVISLDIQEKALENATLLFNQYPEDHLKIHLFKASHEQFPEIVLSKPIRLIVYNLGYLPGGDKTITTKAETTLESLKKSFTILKTGGLISITCYPGHLEGEREQALLLSLLEQLDPSLWHVCHHLSLNRSKSPSLFLIQKKN